MIGDLPCECWALHMPAEPDRKPILICAFDGWYREIEPDDVQEAKRRSDELDAKYADPTSHPFSLERDGTT